MTCSHCGRTIRPHAKWGTCREHRQFSPAYQEHKSAQAIERRRAMSTKNKLALQNKGRKRALKDKPLCERCNRVNGRGGATRLCAACVAWKPGMPPRLPEPPSSKFCPKCREEKHATEFTSHVNAPDWLAMVCKTCAPLSTREKMLLSRYGITEAEYEALWESQGGCCALCGQPEKESYRLHVDHDHTTGIVRGLLCFLCNRQRLGKLTLTEARGIVAYLYSPPAQKIIGVRVVPPSMVSPTRRGRRKKRAA